MKKRLDLVLVERGLVETQGAAVRMIMAGLVSSRGKVMDKPGQAVDEMIEIEIKSRSAYISRGGDKLASVADELDVGFEGKTVLDVGASTGGFSDYALQHGASKVFAVDVGRGQMHRKLLLDSRVVVMDRTDIRDLAELPMLVDLAVVDVSFVSLPPILGHMKPLLAPGGSILALLKPQFEASKEVANLYKGVITDEPARLKIIAEFEATIEQEFEILGAADSKVFGAKGNRERFYWLRNRT